MGSSTENAWICMECSWNNDYETDPLVCKKCYKPIPDAPLNAPYNQDPKYQANTDPPIKIWKCTEYYDCETKNNRQPFYNLMKFEKCQKCRKFKPWDCPLCGKGNDGRYVVCLGDDCLGMKREPSIDLKQIPIADGLLKPYPYKLIEEELQRLRSKDWCSPLEFVHWEGNAFKYETDFEREKRHQEEDSSRQKKILLRGFLVSTSILAVIAKINHFIISNFASSDIEDAQQYHIDAEIICKSYPKFEQNRVYYVEIFPNHIFVDKVDYGSELCLAAFKFREVLVMPDEPGGLKQLEGLIYTVTRDGKIRMWIRDTHLADQEASSPPEWLVKAANDDRLYDLYGNRNVNVESRVAKERNAQHVIITSANATMTQIGLQIAMNNHFVSEFYARMFSAVLSLWVSIGIFQTIYSYYKYGKPIQRSIGVIGRMKVALFIILNNFDQYKDLQLLNFTYHSLVMTLIFSATIITPVYWSIYSNNVLIPLLRNRRYDQKGQQDKDFGMPLGVNEFWLLINQIKLQMGYSYSSEPLDNPQRRFMNELTIKLMENVPQIIFVIQESLWSNYTVSFYQQVFPIIGLITASLDFSTKVGIEFKAKKVYVFFDDFKSKTLANSFDDGWLQSIKPLIDGNKDILPEDWQYMGRMNSAFYIHEQFNLPSSIKKQIDALMFGLTTLTLGQRLENGFKKIIMTHTILLSLFVVLFYCNLNPVDKVSNLIEAGMIPDPRQSEYFLVRFFLKHQNVILATQIFTPIVGYVVTKTYNTLNSAPVKQQSGDQMEPLLQTQASETKVLNQICQEQVTTSSNSIQITFSGNQGYKGDLKVKEGLKAIVVKAAYVKSSVGIQLFRDGKEFDCYFIFGTFDGSWNQTDVVLGQDNEFVKKIKQGDTIKVGCLHDYQVIHLSLELLYEEKQVTPLFSYKCPKDNSHPLTLFHSRDEKLDTSYVALRKEHPGNGCEHDLRQEVNYAYKGGRSSTYGCIATQYFCHECKLSFCGKCANEAREKNKNAFKMQTEIDQNKDSQPQGHTTPAE